MPAAEQILAGLSELTNSWVSLAIAWHLYFVIFGAVVAIQFRPSKRLTGIILCLPLVSVSILAWLAANPFNGTLFGLGSVALITTALRLPRTQIRIAPSWALAPAALMFAFGWAYPHFLDTTSFMPYLYSAPTGLIPCPTLSIVVGCTLATGGLDSRPWSLVLGTVAIFYGVFGALVLGVTIDWILTLGAATLIAIAFFLLHSPGELDGENQHECRLEQ